MHLVTTDPRRRNKMRQWWHMVAQGGEVRISPPLDSDWNLEIQGESVFITGFPDGRPNPSINRLKVRFRIAPSVTWLLDDIDLDGAGDEVWGAIQPAETVEVQVAWAVVNLNPPSNNRVSDWSRSKFATAP